MMHYSLHLFNMMHYSHSVENFTLVALTGWYLISGVGNSLVSKALRNLNDIPISIRRKMPGILKVCN